MTHHETRQPELDKQEESLTGQMSHRWRSAVIALMLAGLWSSSAAPQQSGTALPETITFLNTSTAVIEVEVAGAKTANSQTVLFLEFGPDGNVTTSPAPTPSLPDTVRFTVSSNGVSKIYTPGGSDSSQPFPNKQVAMERVQPSAAPGLYALSIIHLQDIPPGTAESWKLEIDGLPPIGLRAIGFVTQGTFKNLVPTGVSQGPPAIAIEMPPIMAGTAPALTITSSGGLDLSHVTAAQVTVAPIDGISIISIGNATPTRAVLSLSIANCTQPVPRTLTIRDQNVTASTVFPLAAVQQTPRLGLTPVRVTISSTPTLRVTSTGCFDLSGITPAQVTISPVNGISNVTVGGRSATSLDLTFSVASDAPTGNRRLIINNGTSVAADFAIVPRPAVFGRCPPAQHCCERGPLFRCNLCLPLTIACP
jgi:hypothetical protein